MRAELSWHSHYSQGSELLPSIDLLLKHRGAGRRDLQAVLVALGPGSFTGLRVGLSVAKGLAFSLGVPLVGVGTLELEACPFAGLGLPVQPLLDAGRNELATARFAPGEEGLRLVDGPRIASLEEIVSETRVRTIFCGEALPVVSRRLQSALGELALVPPEAALKRRVAALVELGWRRLQRGETESVGAVQPLYLRKPSITVKV